MNGRISDGIAVRLFFAIMLPPDLQAAIYRLRLELTWLPIRASYTPQENLHITLRFLGEVADAEMAGLASELASAVRFSGPMQLRPDHAVLFPPEGSARVLGVGFAGDVEPLCRLQADLELLCRRHGMPAENRVYAPHATLARFRDGLHARHRPRLVASCQSIADLPAFTADGFQLMRSDLSSQGPDYITLARFGGQ